MMATAWNNHMRRLSDGTDYPPTKDMPMLNAISAECMMWAEVSNNPMSKL